jgi:two-component system, cell cycle sensor histidine kinase and response regulator CckA
LTNIQGAVCQEMRQGFISADAGGRNVGTLPDQNTILVIDARPDNLALVCTLLHDAGFKILRTSDPLEGLKMAQREHPDLIISDIAMPEISGLELCRMIRADMELSATPLLLLGGLNKEAESAVEALRMGADGFIDLPFAPPLLIAKVVRLLERKAAERELEHSVTQRTEELARANQRLVEEITERRQVEKALREAEQHAIKEYEGLLVRLGSLAQSLGTARDLLAIYRAVRDFALSSAPCDALAVTLYDPEREERTMDYGWADGQELESTEIKAMPVSDGAIGRTIKSQRVVITHNYREFLRGRYRHFVDPGGNYQVADSALAAPMTIMGRTLGVVEIQSYESNAYTEGHATAISMAANLAANAIENVRLLEREREKEEQLRQSQKMEAVGQLAGGIAHDFNNLLTVISGYSQLSLRRLDPEEMLYRNTLEIKKAGERAAGLTRQLLAFSRKQVLQPKILNLNDVINDTNKMLGRLIGEDIEVGLFLKPGLWKVTADPGQIDQVLLNLAVNARDAMPGGGKLTIKTANVEMDSELAQEYVSVQSGPHVMMTVSDTGCGMDEATQQRIFDPFFTTKEVGKGTGLGLSTVYGIVKQSGGFISVQSEIGKGTTFKLYLPRVDDAVDEEASREPQPESLKGVETILLVEDEDVVRKMLQEILEREGYKVITASNGLEALPVYERHEGTIHLVITDVVMPGMSGPQLVERLAGKSSESKVLYMSGYTDNAIVFHGVLEPGVNFLQKPFTPDALLSKVREVLDDVKDDAPSIHP